MPLHLEGDGLEEPVDEHADHAVHRHLDHHPAHQGRDRGGRLAIIETSGRDDYIPTRRFYARVGYQEAARIRDFYAPGDDKVISVKEL